MRGKGGWKIPVSSRHLIFARWPITYRTKKGAGGALRSKEVGVVKGVARVVRVVLEGVVAAAPPACAFFAILYRYLLCQLAMY